MKIKKIIPYIFSFIIMIVCIYYFLIFFRWFFLDANFLGDVSMCHVSGACWIYVIDNFKILMFGIYPSDQLWRVYVISFVSMLCVFFILSPYPKHKSFVCVFSIIILPLAVYCLMYGSFNLVRVPTNYWGGLFLNLLISFIVITISFPIGLLLAIGRTSDYKIISLFTTFVIEIIRSVPLITILFFATVILPFFMYPENVYDKFIRILIMYSIFSACYLAEIIRGGLQSVQVGQNEAARSLGLNEFQKLYLIILPQALRLSFPDIINQFILIIKSSTLVTIVGLFDILTIVKTTLIDVKWAPYYKEAYTFVALCFWLICYSLARYSQYIERGYKLYR
ncbi:MAG: amino acid ABC transporter permease [Legionellales bacterium]|nr:amino acid ABC transporter permease [Legionellales bacterium]OUX65198.1 MAG: hypothetical protein CBE41_02010 [Gammaproteobacteria bacterium TMED281]